MYSDRHAHVSDRPPAGSNTGAPLTALERLYPNICQEILRLWRHEEIDAYLQGLIVESRHDRQGFPWEVINDLMFLSDLSWQSRHDGARPEVVPSDGEEFTFASSLMHQHEPARPLSRVVG